MSANIYKPRRVSRTVYAFRRKRVEPDQYWTIKGDYTADIHEALTRLSLEEANRFLRVNSHLRGPLEVVEVNITEVRE